MTINKPLVSIIIPTYNRAHLIGQTLDSVLAQTYQNWECIVVDDGSTDTTDEVMSKYIAKDPRFKYYHRPKDRLPGGNAARNYGFEKSRGEYIQWFDSDDLMVANFLEIKLLSLLENPDLQFVVSRTVDYVGDSTVEILKYNGNIFNELSLKNYIKGDVYWMTPDFMAYKKYIGKIRFNEKLLSGQETNFFLVLLGSHNLKGFYINETLTLRRIHQISIQQLVKKDKKKATKTKFLSLSTAYYTVHTKISKENNLLFLNDLIMVFFGLKKKNITIGNFFKLWYYVCKYKSILKGMAFFVSVFLNSTFEKGYFLVNYARS